MKAKDAAEVLSADNLLARVGELEAEARRIAKKAHDVGDLKTALSGIRELSRIVELMAKLTGRLDGNKPPGPGGIDNRRVTVFNFPTLSPEDLKAVENAPTIDLPRARPRLLTCGKLKSCDIKKNQYRGGRVTEESRDAHALKSDGSHSG